MQEKAIFYTPKEARATEVFKGFQVNRAKFIAEMDKRGFDVVGQCIYYKDPIASRSDANEAHWIIKGNFKPRSDPERVIFHDVPTRVVERLERKLGKAIVRL